MWKVHNTKQDSSTNEALGELKKGIAWGYQYQVHSDHIVLVTVRQGGWTAWMAAKDNSRGAIKLKSTQIRWFSWWPGSETGLHERWPKTLKWKLENNFTQPRDLLKLGKSDRPTNRVNLLFLRGCWRGEMLEIMLMMRWEPLCHHRSVRQQHWLLENLRQNLVFILLASYQQVRCTWGQEMDSQRDTNRHLHLDFELLARPTVLYIQWTGFTIILWLGQTNKLIFYLPLIL